MAHTHAQSLFFAVKPVTPALLISYRPISVGVTNYVIVTRRPYWSTTGWPEVEELASDLR